MDYTTVSTPGGADYATKMLDFGQFGKGMNQGADYMKKIQQIRQAPQGGGKSGTPNNVGQQGSGYGFSPTVGPGNAQSPGPPMNIAPPRPVLQPAPRPQQSQMPAPNYAGGMSPFMGGVPAVPYQASSQLPVNQMFGGQNWGGAI